MGRKADRSKECKVEPAKGSQKKHHLGFKRYAESDNKEQDILREAERNLVWL